MALLVWLPLNGNLNNLGLSNTKFITSTATIDNNGKIGSCYSLSATSGNGIYLNTSSMSVSDFMTNYINDHSWTLCAWVITSSSTSTPVFGITYGLRFFCGALTSISLYNSSRTVSCNANTATNDNNWHHVASSYDVTTNKISIYVDGILKNSVLYTSGYTYSSSWTNGVFIGRDPNNSVANDNYFFNGKLNDVRIYDHVLSPKEVHEIAKGLVLHYKLDDNYNSATNLITNGFGELGNTNWSNSYISTTEIPSNDPNIKASFYGNNTTLEYIMLNNFDQYTLTACIKSAGATTGYAYPSLLPYDVDMKFIYSHNEPEGFSTTWKTTLALPLRTGDTVIYATDISNWSTATNNYYFHVAIFGYTDSTGYTYPDMTYTLDCPSFGTYSDKSNLNKTNNTITLKTAYTGKDRPAGTTICQATEGATYFYPFGAVLLSSVSDWTSKTANIIPSNINRLKYARYIRYMAYNGLYHAGIKLVNISIDNIIYDSSGYCNHGTITGTLTTNSNSPRYTKSTVFNGSNSIIKGTLQLNNDYKYTASFWVKPTSFGLTRWIFAVASGSNHLFGCYINGDINTLVGGVVGSNSTVWSAGLLANSLYHIAITSDGTNVKVYKNGELLGTNTKNGTTTGSTFWIGLRPGAAGSYNYHGILSDFRIYCTALSEDDIKELYNTSALIDNFGNIECYNFIEDEDIKINKTGIINSNTFGEKINLFLGLSNTTYSTVVYENDAYTVTILPGKSGYLGARLIGNVLVPWKNVALIYFEAKGAVAHSFSIDTNNNPIYGTYSGNDNATILNMKSQALTTNWNSYHYKLYNNLENKNPEHAPLKIYDTLFTNTSNDSSDVVFYIRNIKIYIGDINEEVSFGSNYIKANQLIEI